MVTTPPPRLSIVPPSPQRVSGHSLNCWRWNNAQLEATTLRGHTHVIHNTQYAIHYGGNMQYICAGIFYIYIEYSCTYIYAWEHM